MKILKGTLKILGAVFGVLFLLFAMGILMEMLGLSGDALFSLLFGWMEFIGIVLPHVTISPVIIVEGTVTLALLGVGAHFFFVWLYRRSRQTTADSSPAPFWRWTWSACAITGFLLLFASGLAISGVIHHAIWLKTTSEPLRNSSWGPMMTKRLMEHVGHELAQCLENNALPRYPEPVKLHSIVDTPKCVITPHTHYSGAADSRKMGLSDGWGTPVMYVSDGRSYVLTSFGKNRIPGGGSGRFDDYIFADGKFVAPLEGRD